MITSLQIGQNKILLQPINGSNSNGNYLVEPDGTCEQWGEFTVGSLGQNTESQSVINLPLEMNDNKYYIHHPTQKTDAGWSRYLRQLKYENVNTKNFKISIYNPDSYASTAGSIFTWRIKGKVKESVRKQLFGEGNV